MLLQAAVQLKKKNIKLIKRALTKNTKCDCFKEWNCLCGGIGGFTFVNSFVVSDIGENCHFCRYGAVCNFCH